MPGEAPIVVTGGTPTIPSFTGAAGKKGEQPKIIICFAKHKTKTNELHYKQMICTNKNTDFRETHRLKNNRQKSHTPSAIFIEINTSG